MSRCNDHKCPTSMYCRRYKQLFVDRENGETRVSVTDFEGRNMKGLCEQFINTEDDQTT